MIIKLVGMITKKTYAKGPTKADVLRQVQQDYPSYRRVSTDRTIDRPAVNDPILPETMEFRK